MNDYQSFEDLQCYQCARELRKQISTFIKTLPAEEKYDLCSQIRRSSRSVTANIAEGYGRFHYKENIHFCRQARGSLTETLDHLNVALDEAYIEQKLYDTLREHYHTCHKLLNGYIAYLKKCASQ